MEQGHVVDLARQAATLAEDVVNVHGTAWVEVWEAWIQEIDAPLEIGGTFTGTLKILGDSLELSDGCLSSGIIHFWFFFLAVFIIERV